MNVRNVEIAVSSIKASASRETFTIHHLTDVHCDDHDFAEKEFLRRVKEIAEDPNAYWIGGGDYGSLILPNDPRFQTGGETVHRLPDVYIETVTEYLLSIRGKCLGFGTGNHECFDAETEVLTSRGWVPFPDLADSDEVASYRTEDGSLEFAVPERVHRYDYDGEMVALHNRHVDLLVTPNHRVLFQSLAPQSQRRKRGTGTVARLRNEKWYARQTVDKKIYYGGTGRETRELALLDLPLVELTREFFDGGWQMERADSLPRIEMKIACCGVTSGSGAVATDDELRAAAWILTDGWVAKRGAVGICQRASNAHSVRSVLDDLGWSYTERVRAREITEICGRQLVKPPEDSIEFDLLSEGRDRAKELVPHKDCLPKWLWSCTQVQFRIFLDAFIDGDGSRHPSAPETSWMVYGRRHLLDDLQALCVFFGYRSTLSEYRPGDLRLNVTPHQMTSLCPKHIGRSQYKGLVYCVTTHNETVVVRRHGKVCVTGNSTIGKHYHRGVGAEVASKLGIAHLYLGVRGWCVINFAYGKRRVGLKAFQYHGWSAGRLKGRKAIQAERDLGSWNADAFFLGHDHQPYQDMWYTEDVKGGKAGWRIHQRPRAFINGGSWTYGQRVPLKAKSALKMSEFPNESWVEGKNFRPQPPASPVLFVHVDFGRGASGDEAGRAAGLDFEIRTRGDRYDF